MSIGVLELEIDFSPPLAPKWPFFEKSPPTAIYDLPSDLPLSELDASLL
jgi:hypothetical protein